jgi:geranylgeranyl diphosphate synthase, type II
MRRGKPTNHKVFGEALAILGGDALLTEAFSLLAAGPEEIRLLLVRELAQASGAAGMVGGQVLDIAEDRPAEEGYLLRLHRLKTGALIRAACRMGVICAGGSADQLAAAATYGDGVGLAFQIADDLLDVTGDPALIGKPVGADEASDRHTFPRVVGLTRSRAVAEERVEQAVAAVAGLEPEPGALTALARYSLERKK